MEERMNELEKRIAALEDATPLYSIKRIHHELAKTPDSLKTKMNELVSTLQCGNKFSGQTDQA